MARLKRLYIHDVPQHVVVRGNDRQNVFLSDADRYYFLGCLQEAATKQGMAIHAYVLMTNHVHLLATGATASSIPKTVQSLGRRYVAHFNAIHGRTGTLWEGRYKAALVQTERYVLNCLRYIELNPVRARLVMDPASYPWSSHRRLAFGERDDLVTPHREYLRLAGKRDPGVGYRDLFLAPLAPEMVEAIRDATEHGWGLGDPDFLEWAGALAGRRAQRMRAPRSDATRKSVRSLTPKEGESKTLGV